MPLEKEPAPSSKKLFIAPSTLEVEPAVEFPPSELTTLESAADGSGAEGPTSARFGDGIIRAALLISVGNVLTRIFGVAREVVLASLFGTAGVAAAFVLADNVLTIFFDLLVSGAISSALVPLLSRYAANTVAEKRAEFWHIVNTLLTVGLLFLVSIVALLQLVTDPLMAFMGQGEKPEIRQLAAGLTRVMVLGIVFLGVSSIMMATLQALQRFAWSALSLAIRNASIVLIALVFRDWGIWSMVVGVVVGTFMLVVLQAPGLRDLPLRPSLDLQHPIFREILRLYRPIFLGLLVTSGVLFIDRAIASTTGRDTLAAMRYATTLQQFTLGLVGSALAIAILPSLSRQAAQTDLRAYRQTLTSGLRLLLVLIIPATLGLLAIALPTISLLYERNEFKETSRWITYVALLGYVPGIPAAALDQMLIFAFYARSNTLTPVLVGVVSNLAYLLLALLTTSLLGWGMIGLVLANSMQQVIHMTVMFVLLRRVFGNLGNDGLWSTAWRAMLASVLLAGVAFLAAGLVQGRLGNGLLANLLAVVAGIGTGGVAYLFALRVLRLNEMNLIWGAVVRKLRK